jgi:deoxyadenosine/deoxycytidine kinase
MSNTVTFITGYICSGKTTMARELTKHKNSVWLSYEEIEMRAEIIKEGDEHTEVFVIDNVRKLTPNLKRFILSDHFTRWTLGKQSITFDMPDIIVVLEPKVPIKKYIHTGRSRLIICTNKTVSAERL